MAPIFIILLLCSVILNLVVIIFLILYIQKTKLSQKECKKTVYELKKINTILQETIDLKTETIQNYQQMFGGG